MTLNREDILKVKDIRVERLFVPEWGGEIFVKGLTGAERDNFESSIISMRGTKQKIDMENVRAKLAALSICDEEGSRMFAATDALALAQKSASALQRIFIVAQRLSGLTEADVNELTEELKANPLGDSLID